MERRLYRGIITPAMVATWLFGLMMVSTPGIVDWSSGWPWVKAVVGDRAHRHPRLLRPRSCAISPPTGTTRPHGFFRLINEVPFVLVIIIVIMVIVKPF